MEYKCQLEMGSDDNQTVVIIRNGEKVQVQVRQVFSSSSLFQKSERDK
jgi:hypothetical protein